MWANICDAILLSSLDESTKALYLMLSFWLVLMLTGLGAGLIMAFISRLFLSTIQEVK